MNDLDLAYDPSADLAAEQACLGAALCSVPVLEDVTAVVMADDWWSPRHALIAAAALAVVEAGHPLDPASVLAELDRRGELLRAGGAPYLHTLVAAANGPAARHHAELVAAKAHLRRVGETGRRLAQLASIGQESGDVDEVLDRARAELDTVAQQRRGRELREFADLLNACVDTYGNPVAPGLATPWPDLDEVLGGGGLRPGALTVIGARPGVGKSVLGCNIAAYIAAAKIGVLVASLEMPEDEWVDRVVAAEAKVDYTRLRNHRLTEQDWAAIDSAAERLKHHPLHIHDKSSATLSDIRSAARELTRKPCGLGLVVIDYLQLVKAAESKLPRQEQVAAIARGCKLLARELAVPVVALSQLNRGPSIRSNSRPTMADLRESGEIENSADQVILLHRDPQEMPGEIELNVAKNRNGRTGTVTLMWQPHYQRAQLIWRGAA